jgi:hypothetical protein
VAVEPKLAERGIEEHAPVGVVGVGELQGDRNVSTNVHGLDGVDDGPRSGVAAVASGARGRVAMSRGGWRVERIEIHGQKEREHRKRGGPIRFTRKSRRSLIP